jgi:hypothetical protein
MMPLSATLPLRCSRSALALVLALLIGGLEPNCAKGQPAPGKKTLPLALDNRALAAVAACEMVACGNSPGAIGLLLGSRQMAVWGDWPAKTPRVRPEKEKAKVLDPRKLGDIRDLKEPTNRELKLRNSILVLAAQTSPEALANSAGETRGGTFEDLLHNPAAFRGKIIPVRGRLKSLVQQGASKDLKRQGIENVYSGVIFTDALDMQPMAVMFTELPGGITPGEKIDYAVAFEGYFFKSEVSEDAAQRIMPMLVGQSIRRVQLPQQSADMEKAPSVRPFLINVKDEKRIPTRDKNPLEFWGYSETIILASKTPQKVLRNSAHSNRYVTFAHLLNDPKRYRGRVIPLEGRLKRLRRLDVDEFMKVRGVKTLYEGWIFGVTYKSTPWCVVFTDLPAGIKVGEDVEYQVKFYGYFFKKYRYRASDTDYYTPLLVGRTIELKNKTASKGLAGTFSDSFVVGITALIGGTAVLVVGLAWWFRRGDRRLRTRLADVHGQPVLEPASGETVPTSGSSLEVDGTARNTAPPGAPDPAGGAATPGEQGFRLNGH